MVSVEDTAESAKAALATAAQSLGALYDSGYESRSSGSNDDSWRETKSAA